jgi:hypothetical protein
MSKGMCQSVFDQLTQNVISLQPTQLFTPISEYNHVVSLHHFASEMIEGMHCDVEFLPCSLWPTSIGIPAIRHRFTSANILH